MRLNRFSRLRIMLEVILICYSFQIPILLAGELIEFCISIEPMPGIFVQKKPQLFPTPEGRFIVAWEDYRTGETSHFAQRFDSTGLPLDKNFKVVGNTDVAFLPEGTGMIIGTTEEWIDGELGYYIVNAQILYSTGGLSNPFLIDQNLLPDCGTGFWGLGEKLRANNNGFVFGSNFGGNIEVKKIDPDGTIIFDSADLMQLPQTAATFSLAINKHGEYVILWFNSDPAMLPSGIYATFISSGDSIIADSVLVQPYPPGYRYESEAPQLRAITVADTLFEFFWTDLDSLDISYITYDISGNALTSVASIELPFFFDGYRRELVNFAFSNMRFGNFYVLLTFRQLISNPNIGHPEEFITRLHCFNMTGDLLKISPVDSSYFPRLGDNLAQISPNILACPVEISNDIFRCTMQDLSWLDSLLVNDDIQGANQLSPQVAVKDSQSFFVSWQDEKGFYGRLVNKEGTLLNEEVSLDSKKIIFLASNYAVNFWSRQLNSNSAAAGMTIYDPHTWRITSRDTLARSEWYGDLSITGVPISDSAFVVLIAENRRLRLESYFVEGRKIKEKLVVIPAYYVLGLIPNNSASFWVSWDGKVQLFSNQLEPLTSILALGLSASPILYIGQGRFLETKLSSYPRGIFAGILDTTGTELNRFQLITELNANNLELTQLDSAKFLAMWSLNKNIYAQTFTFDGKSVTDTLTIHTDVAASRDWLDACVINDKVLFVWADNRNWGNGYDIYGSIHDLKKITSVTEEELQSIIPTDFCLYQNYPNPFNATTVIPFDLPHSSYVVLEIYNLMGKKVRTLLADQKPAGHFEVQWDGTDELNQSVASGVYFCSLKIGKLHNENLIRVRKLLLLR